MCRFCAHLASLEDRGPSLELGRRPLRDAEGVVSEVLRQFRLKDNLIIIRNDQDLQEVDITT